MYLGALCPMEEFVVYGCAERRAPSSLSAELSPPISAPPTRVTYPDDRRPPRRYATATQLKILLVVDDGAAQAARDAELKSLLQRVHKSYVSYLRNPFAAPHAEISSPRFASEVDQHIAALARSAPPIG